MRIDKSKSCKECGKAQAGICGKSGEGMIMEAGNDNDVIVINKVESVWIPLIISFYHVFIAAWIS